MSEQYIDSIMHGAMIKIDILHLETCGSCVMCWKTEGERRQFLDALRKVEVGGCLFAISGGMIELRATRRSVYIFMGKQGLVKVLV